MKAHDVRAALATVAPAGEVRTAEQDAAAFARLATFEAGALYAGRFAGLTPWERHPGADELLYCLEGASELTLLLDAGPERVRLAAGAVCVVPRGVWHRQDGGGGVTLLSATPDHTEISEADDPRT